MKILKRTKLKGKIKKLTTLTISTFNLILNRRPRPKESSDQWRIYFQYIDAENKSQCQLCKAKLSGNSESNNKRHFMTKHPEKASEFGVTIWKRKRNEPDPILNESKGSETDPDFKGPPLKKEKKMSRGEFIRNCVELVTVSRLPIQAITSRAFQNLTKSHSEQTGVDMNASNLKRLVALTASELRIQIKQETKDQMISLKLDISHSSLVLHIQFYSKFDRKIVIRTLGVIKLKKNKFPERLEQEIHEMLRLYDIEMHNVYSLTSDNESNCLSSEVKKDTEESDDSESEEKSQRSFNPFSLVDEEKSTKLEGISRHLKDLFTSLKVTQSASHILFNAVDTLLKISTKNSGISEIVELLRSSECTQIFKRLKMPLPKLSIDNSWSSLFLLFSSLRQIKEKLPQVFKKLVATNVQDAVLSEEQWNFIEKFCEAFSPAYETKILLQSKQLPMSKFRE